MEPKSLQVVSSNRLANNEVLNDYRVVLIHVNNCKAWRITLGSSTTDAILIH